MPFAFFAKQARENPEQFFILIGLPLGILTGIGIIDYTNPWNLTGWIIGIIILVTVGVGIKNIAEHDLWNDPWTWAALGVTILTHISYLIFGELLMVFLFSKEEIMIRELFTTHLVQLVKPVCIELVIVTTIIGWIVMLVTNMIIEDREL